MNKVIIGIIFFVLSSYSFAGKIELEKKDYIKLIASSYVHGFSEFDTSITSFENSVSIGIYYDASTQKKSRAEQLAARIRIQVPALLNTYQWGKEVKVRVTVHSEDRTGRGY